MSLQARSGKGRLRSSDERSAFDTRRQMPLVVAIGPVEEPLAACHVIAQPGDNQIRPHRVTGKARPALMKERVVANLGELIAQPVRDPRCRVPTTESRHLPLGILEHPCGNRHSHSSRATSASTAMSRSSSSRAGSGISTTESVPRKTAPATTCGSVDPDEYRL